MKEMQSLGELIREEEKRVDAYNMLVFHYNSIMEDTERRRHKYGEFEQRFVREQMEFAQEYLDKIPDAEKAVLETRRKIKAYFESIV